MLWSKLIDAKDRLIADLEARLASALTREAVVNEQLCRTEDQVEKLLEQNRYLRERLRSRSVHTFEVG